MREFKNNMNMVYTSYLLLTLPGAQESQEVDPVAFLNIPLGQPMQLANPPSLVL
jgi:hypothetical protein